MCSSVQTVKTFASIQMFSQLLMQIQKWIRGAVSMTTLERVTFARIRFGKKAFSRLQSVPEVFNREANMVGFSGIILGVPVGRNAWLY